MIVLAILLLILILLLNSASGARRNYKVWQFQDVTPLISTEENPIVVFNSLPEKVKVLPRAVPTGFMFEKFFAKIFLLKIFFKLF